MTIASLRFSDCRDRSAVSVEFPQRRDASRAVVTFKKVEFVDNGGIYDEHYGGAVRAIGRTEDAFPLPELRFRSCRFIQNRAAIGGAVFAQDVDVSIRRSSFGNNSARLAGGALYFDSTKRANVRIRVSSFTNNDASGEGNVPNATNASPCMMRTEMPTIIGKGGAVFVCGAIGLDVEDSDFKGNVGCQGGGGIAAIHHRTPLGNETGCVFRVAGSHFQNNSALCGSQRRALYVAFFSDTCCVGGALSGESLDETLVEAALENSTFVENYARGGGAISFRSTHKSSAEHRVNSCQFRENVALIVGGAATLTRCRTSVVNSSFVRNKSVHGGALYNWGATLIIAEHPDDPSAKSLFEENTASIAGGGIHAHFDSSYMSCTSATHMLWLYRFREFDSTHPSEQYRLPWQRRRSSRA